MCSTDNKDERVEKYIRLLEQKNVDGILIGTGVGNADILALHVEKSFPIVMIARETVGIAVHRVLNDDFKGGTIAAEHLLEKGHRKMAVLSEDFNVSSSFERVRGFRFGLFEAGISLDPKNIFACESNIKDETGSIRDSPRRGASDSIILLQRLACHRRTPGCEGRGNICTGTALYHWF